MELKLHSRQDGEALLDHEEGFVCHSILLEDIPSGSPCPKFTADRLETQFWTGRAAF
jgi:hypothetical protein